MSQNDPSEDKTCHDLHVFMEQVTSEMSSEYQRIYARSAEDPGTAGDEGEENWANLFRDWLPPTYHIETKGRLIGHDGRMSPQIDVLVLKPAYPKKLLEKKVWLAGGVAAAFECKNTLTAAHVKAAVERCVAFKSLFPDRKGSPRTELRSPLIYGLLAHSHSWKGQRSDPVGNIERALADASGTIDHPRKLLDLICVADLACWQVTYMTSYDATWSPAQDSLRQAFGAARGALTSHVCASFKSQSQSDAFRPVGALIASLINDLAWNDPSVRDLADYYRMANLQGNSSGNMRPWPSTVYSEEVRPEIVAGRFTNGVPWDEWSVGG